MRRLAAVTALLSLSVWISFPIYFGAIAVRATFGVLPSRMLAGEVNARMSAVQDLWVAGAAALFLAAVIVLLRSDRETGVSRRALLTRLPLGVFSASLVSRFILEPRMISVRRSLPVALVDLSEKDPGRVAFSRLHGISSVLLLFVIAAGVVSAILLVPLLERAPAPAEAPTPESPA